MAVSRPVVMQPVADESAQDRTTAKLAAHFATLDDSSLIKIARAIETARAVGAGDPSDDQVLECLRPRLIQIRPPRVRTFFRGICSALRPLLHDCSPGAPKIRGMVSRLVVMPWWQAVRPQAGQPMADLDTQYRAALIKGDTVAVEAILSHARELAGQATQAILEQAETSPVQLGDLATAMGGNRGIEDLREISLMMRHAARILPILDAIRTPATLDADDKIESFIPASALAAKSGYLTLQKTAPETVELFFVALMRMLAQPWQAMRLVQLLSAELGKIGANDQDLKFIPGRLFDDLTRTMEELGQNLGGEGAMSRRVWLITCARLLTDAGGMIRGLAEEGDLANNPEWDGVLTQARQKVVTAADSFATTAVTEALAVLPVTLGKGDSPSDQRAQPDVTRRPSDEDIATARAAGGLFIAARKLAEQEGFARSIRSKESDLEQRFSTAVNFRLDFLRARGKNPVIMAQFEAVRQVLGAVTQSEPIRDLTVKVERAIERFR